MPSPTLEATFDSPPTGASVLLEERYELHAQLGEGASGTVWEATERASGKRVALKRIRPGLMGNRQRVAERFVAESHALARLRHPHLVRIEAVLTERGGAPCLVMERLRGRTLAELLQVRPQLGVEETFRLLVPLMGALAIAHDSGVLHRDVKPANLFLRDTDQGGDAWPVLLDFGAAKLDDGGGKATTSGMTVGTPCYMAPEQAQGLALGPHTDVWAMGVVWYRCLTGALPFDAETSLGVVIKLSRERAPRLSTVMPELPVSLAVAVDRALEPAPGARYPDMRAFACALAHAAAQAGLDVPGNPEPQAFPEYPRWLEEADAESTAALASLPPAVAQANAGSLDGSSGTGDSAHTDQGAATWAGGPRPHARNAALAASLILLAFGSAAAVWWAEPRSAARSRNEVAVEATGVEPAPAWARPTAAGRDGSAAAESTAPAALAAAPGESSVAPSAPASATIDGPSELPALAPAPEKPSHEASPAEHRRAARTARAAPRKAQRLRPRRSVAHAPKTAPAPTPVAAPTEPSSADAPKPPHPVSTKAPSRPRVIEDFNW